MKRRTFLTAAAGAAAAIAGCAGAAPETPDDGAATTEPPTDESTDESTATPTDSPGSGSPSIAGRSLERRPDCESSGTAGVSTDGTTVTVEGCIAGRNGCVVPVLAEASYDADADELAVRVATESNAEPDESCTQAIVHRGYRVTVEFDGRLPKTTTVVHDGMDGETQVAQSRTGDGGR